MITNIDLKLLECNNFDDFNLFLEDLFVENKINLLLYFINQMSVEQKEQALDYYTTQIHNEKEFITLFN